MKTTIRFGMVAALVIVAGMVRGAEEKPFDPAARAKVIAPFLEEQTVAVVHVDLTRIDVVASLDEVGRLLPEAQPQIAAGKAAGTALLAGFTQAGVKDIYLGVTLAGPSTPEDLFFFAVPLSPGANERVIARMIQKYTGEPFSTIERIGDVLLLTRSREMADRLKSLPPVAERKISPDLEKAFAAAGDTAAQLVVLPPEYSRRVIAEMMPTLPAEVGGGPSSVLTDGLRWAAVGVDFPPKLALRVTIQSKDNAAAEALAKQLGILWQKLGENERVRRELPDLERTAKVLTPTVEGDRLVLVLDQANQGAAALVEALRRPAEVLRRDVGRDQSMNNLKQMMLAMHNYHDARKVFPADVRDAQGKPLLSWRVLILPFVEENKLYQEFHHDEPWDSPHNKKLIERMPNIYRSPASKLTERGRTNYVGVVGQGTLFGEKKGLTFRDIPDGSSNTIMLVEADDDHAVIWTKPDDLPLDPKQPNKGLGGLWGDDSFLTALCDGSVRTLKRTIDPELLRRLFLRNDGKPVNEAF
jgi:hypothetical protein